MYHYVILTWNCEASHANIAAKQMGDMLVASATGWNRTFSVAGAMLFTRRAGESARNYYLLADDAGVVFGQLFSSTSSDVVPRSVDRATSVAIVDSRGKELTTRYWGGYVALLRGRIPQ